MPGIAGIISPGSSEANEHLLSLMIGCMLHEPSYASGTYVNPQLGVYLGWVCHSGSFSDCMPVMNEAKDLVLIFSGEDFSDKEKITQLGYRGHKFDPFNASYLIHLYEEEEENF